MAAKNDSHNEADSKNDDGPRLDLTGQFQWSLNSTSLKKLAPFILGLLGGGSILGGAWTVFQDKLPSTPNQPLIEQPASDRLPSSSITQHYSCKEIGDYQKAQELLAEGHTYLDGDGDGVACDSLK